MWDRRQAVRLADLSLRLVDEIGRLVNTLPYVTAAYHERSPLMGEIRPERIDV
jgi:hypothetical protein